MEYIYLAAFLAPFVYIFGYHSRYSYGTKEILEREDGYRIVSFWGEFEIKKEEIVKEDELRFWDLSCNFDYNPFRMRYYAYFPCGDIRIVTRNHGFIKYHILPKNKLR